MSPQRRAFFELIGWKFLYLLLLNSAFGAEPVSVSTGWFVEPQCEDKLTGKVIVDPDLTSELFTTSTHSYPWHIVVHADGHLEDTVDGSIDDEDLVRIEHTANCVSTHQGEHEMEFCWAVLDEKTVRLKLWGGLPAYFSELRIEIDADKNFRCSFGAVYPAQREALRWKITKKEFRVRTIEMDAGRRLYGWLSVEFEESVIVDEKKTWKPYKIEGYIKPVIQDPPVGEANDEAGAAK